MYLSHKSGKYLINEKLTKWFLMAGQPRRFKDQIPVQLRYDTVPWEPSSSPVLFLTFCNVFPVKLK